MLLMRPICCCSSLSCRLDVQTVLASQYWYPQVSSTSKCQEYTAIMWSPTPDPHWVVVVVVAPCTAVSCVVIVTDNMLAMWPQNSEPRSLLLAAPCKQLVELRVLPQGVLLKPLLQTADRLLKIIVHAKAH